jgi:polyisoprenoid-binding protein YceI
MLFLMEIEMKLIILPFFFLSLCLCLKAAAFPLEAQNGKSEFLAIGRPAALKIVGRGAGPTGELTLQKEGDSQLLSGEVHLDLESFDTGIGLRDKHMKETYLETGKSKNAVLKFSQARLNDEILQKGGEARLPGVLQLHGVEKPIEIQMNFSHNPDGIKALSSFEIKISDFAIAIPSFSGIKVADLVQIKIETLISKTSLDTSALEQK